MVVCLVCNKKVDRETHLSGNYDWPFSGKCMELEKPNYWDRVFTKEVTEAFLDDVT